MRILITGGAGYLGYTIVELIQSMPDVEKIIIYDNLSRGNYQLFLNIEKSGECNLQFIEADILDTRRLKMAAKESDIVIHLAAKVTTPFDDKSASEFEQINHWGTAEVSYAVEEAHISKVIYMSSAAIYGFSSVPVNRSNTPNPQTYYGISKYNGEKYLSRLKEKKDVYILRAGNVYGYNPAMRFDTVINKFAFDTKLKKRLRIHGSGNQKRAFVHLDTIRETVMKTFTGQLSPGIYDVVDHNSEILKMAFIFKELAPELEMVFLDQDIEIPDQIVRPENSGEIKKKEISGRLIKLLDQFSF